MCSSFPLTNHTFAEGLPWQPYSLRLCRATGRACVVHTHIYVCLCVCGGDLALPEKGSEQRSERRVLCGEPLWSHPELCCHFRSASNRSPSIPDAVLPWWQPQKKTNQRGRTVKVAAFFSFCAIATVVVAELLHQLNTSSHSTDSTCYHYTG